MLERMIELCREEHYCKCCNRMFQCQAPTHGIPEWGYTCSNCAIPGHRHPEEEFDRSGGWYGVLPKGMR